MDLLSPSPYLSRSGTYSILQTYFPVKETIMPSPCKTLNPNIRLKLLANTMARVADIVIPAAQMEIAFLPYFS